MLRRPQVLHKCLDAFLCRQSQRVHHLSTSSALASGHNKWSSIKHDKGRNDARKSKERTLVLKDVTYASNLSGPDLNANARLAAAVASAKRAGTSKASIEAAIARGQGRSLSGAALENVLVEAVLPPVAIIVECQTDSKARTLADVRHLIKQHGGIATPTKYLFEKRGRIVFQKDEVKSVDDVLEPALEAGALDVTMDSDGRIVVETEPTNVTATAKRLVQDANLETASIDTTWIANAETTAENVAKPGLHGLVELYEQLQSYPEVESVFTNLDLKSLPDEIRSRLEPE